MTTNIPYLSIDNDLQCKWMVDEDIMTNGIHRMEPYVQEYGPLDTGEVVVNFIRYSRNYFAVYTNFQNSYEYKPNEFVKLNLPSSIPPCYEGGYYIGYDGGFVNIVDRNEPDKYSSLPVKDDINTIMMIKYSKYVIMSCNKSTIRYFLQDNKLTEPKPILQASTHIVQDDDGAVIAAAHVGGKISVVWTTSWKTHHTLRSPPMLDLVINKNYMAGITQTKAIYVWSLVSGDTELCFTSTWCFPDRIFINEDILPFGLTAVSIDNSLVSTFGIGEDAKGTEWEPMKISPKMALFSTCLLPYTLSSVEMWNTRLILHADGKFMRFRYSMNERSFVWYEDIIHWIKNPKEELYLEPLTDSSGNIPQIIINTIVTHMSTVVENLLEIAASGNKLTQWCMNRLMKNEDFKREFTTEYEYNLINIYNDEGFGDREVTCNIILNTRMLSLELSHLYESLPLPDKVSDYIFWVVLTDVRPREKEKIAKNRDFIHHVYIELDKDCPEKRRLALELLQALSSCLGDTWKVIFNDEQHHFDYRMFEFIDSSDIKGLCERGYATNLIYMMESHKQNQLKPNQNVKNCWNNLVAWLLTPAQLNTIGFPNLNDGVWKRQKVEDIPHDAWVVIDDVVQQWRAGKLEDDQAEIKCWIPYKDRLQNAIERALYVLDRDVWGRNGVFKVGGGWKLWDGEMTLDSGMEIHISQQSVEATVVDWPLVILRSGIITKINIKTVGQIIYRCTTPDWMIPPKLRNRTETYMKKLVLDKKLPALEPANKSVLFEMLEPSVVTDITRMQTLLEFTAMAVEPAGNVWFGTYCGDIVVVKADDLMTKNRNMIELLNSNHETITSMSYGYGFVASASDDAVVQIWNCSTLRVKCVLSGKCPDSVKSVRFVSSSTVWLLSSKGSVFAWNFVSDNKPELVQSLRSHTRDITLNHYCMDTYEKYAIVNTSRIVQWFVKYPYHMNEIRNIKANCVIMFTELEYIVGNDNGYVMLYTVADQKIKPVEIWKSAYEITSLKILDTKSSPQLAIGTKGGEFVIKDLNQDYPCFDWKLNSDIVSIEYTQPYIIILCGDYTVFTLVFVANNIKLTCQCLLALSKQADWRNFLRKPSKTEAIQDIVIEGARNKIGMESWASLLQVILQEEDNMKAWCRKKILLVLQVGALGQKKKAYEDLMFKLFCFSGKKFTCTLCLGSSSSPKRFPISAINTCMHRFHTKCIEEHIRKTAEYDNECQYNYALHVDLKCPICRTPFKPEHLVEDKFTAEMCKYVSDDDSEDDV